MQGQHVDERVAQVVCRQLGYTVGRLIELDIVNDGSQQIWMDDTSCQGNESKLELCSFPDHGNWQ